MPIENTPMGPDLSERNREQISRIGQTALMLGEADINRHYEDGSFLLYLSHRKKNGDLKVRVYDEKFSWRRRLSAFFPNIPRGITEHTFVVDTKGRINISSWRTRQSVLMGTKVFSGIHSSILRDMKQSEKDSHLERIDNTLSTFMTMFDTMIQRAKS